MLDAIDRAIERYGPEAVCETLLPMLTPERVTRIDQVLATRLTSVITLVEDTYDPHNAAATIRTTEALGLGELHAIEPNGRFTSAAGVTRGSHKWLELVRWTDATTAIRALQARGFRVFATTPAATASLEDVDVRSPLAIAFGNEHAGLTPEAVAASDGAVRVPMFGFSESFNLSVTVGIAMSRIASRRRAELGVDGDLSEDRRRYLRARWFALKVRAAVGILERALDQNQLQSG